MAHAQRHTHPWKRFKYGKAQKELPPGFVEHREFVRIRKRRV
jgi:hypothetical protein